VGPLWQRRLGEAVASVGELLDLLGLEAASVGADGRSDFPLRVPRSFVARMRPGDPRDPLLAQVLPVAAERRAPPGFTRDPLAEAAASPAPGLLHKYRGRALLVLTGACGVHCRYCFRRHFPYAEHRDRDARAALAYVAAEPSIEEVIVSGGDPLALADERLAALAEAIAAIPHVRRLRLHTRMPIVLPERVDDALTAWLAASPLQKVVVVHANHPQEIDGEVAGALRRLGATGATLLNQAVLLAGVNDAAATQRELGETLFAAGVLPYYLHLLDRVAGAAHFAVDEAAARRIMAELTASTPGYLVPRLVREVPGAPAKVPVDLRLGSRRRGLH
jgi:EF-P beta-lysylation protein EpmB